MNENVSNIILRVIQYGIIGIGLLWCFLVLSNTADDMVWAQRDLLEPSLSNLFYLIYVAIAICVIAAVVFGLYHFISNIKSQVGTIIGLIGLLILGLISYYGLADGSILGTYEVSGEVVPEETILTSGAAIIFTYCLAFVAIGAVAVTEIIKIFK